jgi:hypothetical protein
LNMKLLNDYRMRLVVAGIVAGIVLGIGQARADFTFGEPVNLGSTVNSSSGDALDYITADGLIMYFDSYNRPGGRGGWDIWVTTRETINDDWGTPVNLGPPVNTGQTDSCAYISANGLELYFSSNRSGGHGGLDIWVTKRSTKDDAWGVAENLGSLINSPALEFSTYISTDGLELYFNSMRSGGYGSDDIWVTRRTTVNDPWGPPANLGAAVNSSASEAYPFPSSDGLALFFSEERNQTIRPGGLGNADLWMTRRTSVSDIWGTPVNLGPIVNTPYYDGGPRISPDGSTLYFCSERPGGYGGPYGDIYQAPIIPIVDFNGDRIVDAEDMCIMVDHWGTDYSLCDIGPMPWGDGVVDVEDLKVLAEHLFEEVDDPTLIAHWPLDEIEGMIAHDIVSGNNDLIMGDPVWQPAGGKVDGALELDGIDDCIFSSAGPNSAEKPFSVVAWIKGDTPGQVIISQPGGVNWLAADADGNLMTEFKGAGRSTGPLFSETVITDEQWHRIGLVWDGSRLQLFVDGVIVAEDTQSGLGIFTSGLYIGVGKNYATGTFWSGLIDDVRIYNRVVNP